MAFKDVYKEIAELITDNIGTIKWVDLWANQTDFFADEYPFPFPAVFIEMNANQIASVGKLDQDIELAITFHVAVETVADSYQGSYNQDNALQILDLLIELHQLLHGKAGENFSRLNRMDIQQETQFGNVLQYAVTYITVIRDYSAEKQYQQVSNLDLNINR